MNASGARKIKILGIVIGVTAAVCLIIKYLLPLLTPFVIAFLIAVIIEKPVKFLTERLRLRRSVSAAIMVIFVVAVLAAVIIWGGRSIIRQLNRLMANFDIYVSEISGVVEDCCCKIDECFGLKDGTSFDVVSEQFVKMSDGLGDNVVPAIMNKSWNVISGFVVFFTAMAFTVIVRHILTVYLHFIGRTDKDKPRSAFFGIIRHLLYYPGHRRRFAFTHNVFPDVIVKSALIKKPAVLSRNHRRFS